MPVTSPEFKQALARFVSGVTVVAVEVEGQRHGMTASAFLSVSLDPPLVLVSVAKKAKMHAHIQRASHWSATILRADQEAISSHFAGYGEADVRWVEGLAPRVDGGIAFVVCSAFAAHDAGDHTLFVGQVEEAGATDGTPLVYFSGKYRSISA